MRSFSPEQRQHSGANSINSSCGRLSPALDLQAVRSKKTVGSITKLPVLSPQNSKQAQAPGGWGQEPMTTLLKDKPKQGFYSSLREEVHN
jgi:hypothetical protein